MNAPPRRHLGDLGNIRVQDKVAQINITDTRLSLDGPESVLDRSIVVSAAGNSVWQRTDFKLIFLIPLRTPSPTT